MQKLLLQTNFWRSCFVYSKSSAFLIIIGLNDIKIKPQNKKKGVNQKLVMQKKNTRKEPEVSFAFKFSIKSLNENVPFLCCQNIYMIKEYNRIMADEYKFYETMVKHIIYRDINIRICMDNWRNMMY